MWRRQWLRKQRDFKKSLRGTHVYSVFGKRALHGRLWKTDKRSLAGGLALGLFVAFTPTIPLQMLLAAAGAILFKVNLPIALAACWITNPLTAVPIYMAAWRLGRRLIGHDGPIRDFVDLIAGKTGSGRLIRQSLYLWTGSLFFAAAAAAAGNITVRVLWNVGARLADATKRIELPKATQDITKALIPVFLVAAGFVLQKLGWIDVDQWVARISGQAGQWWVPPVLIGLMVIMYAFALPGSLLIVVSGILYPPWFATALSTVGGVAGGALAYLLARNMSSAHMARYAEVPLFKSLRTGAGFSLLSALRLLPGFPHAIISYSAGTLGIRLPVFLASLTVGFILKALVYTSAVHTAAHVDPATDLWSFKTLWPLFALVLLAAGGLIIERRLVRRVAPDVPSAK